MYDATFAIAGANNRRFCTDRWYLDIPHVAIDKTPLIVPGALLTRYHCTVLVASAVTGGCSQIHLKASCAYQNSLTGLWLWWYWYNLPLRYRWCIWLRITRESPIGDSVHLRFRRHQLFWYILRHFKLLIILNQLWQACKLSYFGVESQSQTIIG